MTGIEARQRVASKQRVNILYLASKVLGIGLGGDRLKQRP